MIDSPFKGGRSNKAPYETTHLRVPVPLRFVLQKAIDLYKTAVASGDIFAPTQFIEEQVNNLKGYHSWAGSLVNENKIISASKYHDMVNDLSLLSDEINCLHNVIDELTINSNAARLILEEACLLKPNAGGAIKKQVKKAIEILD